MRQLTGGVFASAPGGWNMRRVILGMLAIATLAATPVHAEDCDLVVTDCNVTLQYVWLGGGIATTPPENLTAIAGATSIAVDWDAPAFLPEGKTLLRYTVYRLPGTGPLTSVVSFDVDADETFYDDTDADPAGHYLYFATAVFVQGSNHWDETVSVPSNVAIANAPLVDPNCPLLETYLHPPFAQLHVECVPP